MDSPDSRKHNTYLNISTHTYVDEYDPQTEIFAAVAFGIFSRNNRQKGYIPDQLIFGCDMILLKKYM